MSASHTDRSMTERAVTLPKILKNLLGTLFEGVDAPTALVLAALRQTSCRRTVLVIKRVAAARKPTVADW